MTNAVLDRRDDRLDDDRVGGRLRRVADELQVLDVGRVEGGNFGRLGRRRHVVRVGTQHREATHNLLRGRRAERRRRRVQVVPHRVDRNVPDRAGDRLVGLVR